MADYTGRTGTTGTMMIRDHGNLVEFWLISGQSSTFANGKSWSWSSPHGSASGTYNYPSGNSWRLLGSTYVSANGYVYFSIGNSGTQGIGGPTTISAYLTRTTIPNPPVNYAPDMIGHTSVRVKFSWNGDGGSAVTGYQVGYGRDPNNVQFLATGSNDGYTPIGGLTLGTTWYFWVRALNANGWSGWSARQSARTLAGSRVKHLGVVREAIPMVKVAGVWRQAIPFAKQLTVWKDGK